MEITNIQSIIGIEKSFICAKLNSPGASLSNSPEELFQRSMIFSTVLCLVGTKNIKHDRGTFLQGFKKVRSARTPRVPMALAPGKGGLSLKEDQH